MPYNWKLFINIHKVKKVLGDDDDDFFREVVRFANQRFDIVNGCWSWF